jgi:hypothetical protein
MSQALAHEGPTEAAEAHDRFIAALAQRVAWQVDAAYPPPAAPERPVELPPAPPAKPKPKRRRKARTAPKTPAARATTESAGFAGWSLWTLADLVEEHGPAHPGRRDEWRWQLLYLRFHAGADGMLPRDFDPLVESTFAELL